MRPFIIIAFLCSVFIGNAGLFNTVRPTAAVLNASPVPAIYNHSTDHKQASLKKKPLKERIFTRIIKSKLYKMLHRAEGKKGNTAALLSLILGVASFILMFTGIGALIIASIAAAIAAIVLGIIAPKRNGKKNGMAIAGLILGILALLLLAFLVVIAVAIIGSIFGGVSS